MTFRVRTTSNDKQSIQLSVVTGEKGYTELRVSERDEKGTYAEASMVLSPEQWREVAEAALVAAEVAEKFTDLTYLSSSEVAAIRAKEAEVRKAQDIINLRSYIGKTKGWTLLGYKDDANVAKLIEQGLVKSQPWAVNNERTVYKLTKAGQEVHDQWVIDNTPVTPPKPVTTYAAPKGSTPVTAASKTYVQGSSSTTKAATATAAPKVAGTSGTSYTPPLPTGAQTKVGDKIPPYVKPAQQPIISGAKS